MDTGRKNEIKAKAKEINDFSEQFQLLHATHASQEFIKDIVREAYQEKLREVKKRIDEKTERNLDATKELKEKEDLERVIGENRFLIDVDYIDVEPEIARVTKVGKFFSIYLARSLKDSMKKEDGRLDYNVIRDIRELMAHELGHIVLHTKEVLSEEGTQGTLNIKDSEKEQEAKLFADELLNLRRLRNEQIRKDGGADHLF